MKNFFYCANEEEKQELRDKMLEHMYWQIIATRREVADIRRKIMDNTEEQDG